MGLHDHYLGQNNVDIQSGAAECKLQQTTYSGKQRQWNFEQYSKLHKDQHTILTDLTAHGYAGIDERSKVRYLMNGIKTTDLDLVKTQIMASAPLRNDFDGCVALFKDFISTREANESHSRKARVASVGTTTTSYEDLKPDMSVQDRYYKKSEYQKLTRAQKKGLKLKRKERTDGYGRSNKKQKTVTFDERTIKSLGTAIASKLQLHKTTDDTKESSSDDKKKDSDDGKSSSNSSTRNRDNKSLQRKE